MRTKILALTSAAFLPIAALAQTPFIWNGGSGNWSTSSMWSTGTEPDSPTADVMIDNGSGAGSVVTLNTGAGGGHVELGRLRIDTGDTLTFGANMRLISNAAAFPGAGVWTINGTLSLPLADNYLEGTKTFNGTGKIVIGAAPAAGNISNVYDDTVNNITIEGAARFGGYNTSKPRIVNNGLFHANIPGAALELRGRDVLTAATAEDNVNAGTLKSTNGATLFMGEGDWQNAGGQILADGAGSILMFGERARIFGGAISATNGGLIRIASGGTNAWKDVTVSGPTEVNLGSIPFEGTVTNNGTITVSGSGQIYSINVPHDPIVIAGTGQIILDKPDINSAPAFDDAYGKWLIQGQLIRGRGRIGSWSGGFGGMEIQITNRGTFQADRNNEWLHIDVERFDNASGGTVRAQDGGLLFLNARQPLTNVGGTIEALSGGRIEAGFARIEGGLVRNFGGDIRLRGMQLYNPGSGMRLEGDLKLGVQGESQEAGLINGIENTGILRVRSFGQDARLRIGEPANPGATLTGGGQIILGDASNGSTSNYIFETSNVAGSTPVALNNVDNTIRGFGLIGDANIGRLSLTNTSLITADVTGKMLTVRVPLIDNTNGIFRSENGGHLRVETFSGFDNVGGLVEAKAGSTCDLHWLTTFTGGTFRNDGGSFNLGYATLVNPGSGLTLQGAMHISNGLTTRLVGDITNEGSIQGRSTSSDTKLLIGRDGTPNVHMTGGGVLFPNDPSGSGDKGRIDEGTTGANLYLDDQELRGFGWVGTFNRGLNVINNDAISADVSTLR